MEVYPLFLLVICCLISLSLSNEIEKNDDVSGPGDLKEKYLEKQRQPPKFRMSNMKFVVNLKPQDNKPYAKEKMTRMTLMPHLTPKFNSVTFATTQRSRKPLMKLKTYTIDSRANGRYNRIENIKRISKSHGSNKEATSISKYINRTDSKTPILEENNTEVNLPKENPINDEKRQRLDNADEKDLSSPQDQERPKSRGTVISESIIENFSSEEEKDRHEFIFLENQNDNHVVTDINMLDDTNQDHDNGIETTTEFKVVPTKLRVKRSNNIIEEENISSTISGLKYTGRDARINNYAYFKNINC